MVLARTVVEKKLNSERWELAVYANAIRQAGKVE